MRIVSQRFGTIEIDDDRVIVLPAGLLGFGDCTRYVLHESETAKSLAWLQSIDRPDIAFPVMDASRFPGYPDVDQATLAHAANVPGRDLALLVVIAVTNDNVVANLLAPIVIDLETRRGAQIVLDPRHWSASHNLRTQTAPETETETEAAEAY